MLGALLLEVWFYPHYASPAMAVIIALILLGMRELRSWQWRGRPAGLFLVRAIPTAVLLLGLVPITALVLNLPLDYWPLQWYGGSPGVVQPPSLTAQVTAEHKKALVFVRYSPTHDLSEEWVYNKPEIDKAPVVWARELDPTHDASLIRYFSNRSVWVFEPDKHPWKLQPYTPVSKPQRSNSTPFR
jgi:hypothetical protein